MSGLRHDANGPEKILTAFEPELFAHDITINTLPTMLLAKHFTTLLKSSTATKFAILSARVGSISDNHPGGWYSYRTSKVA